MFKKTIATWLLSCALVSLSTDVKAANLVVSPVQIYLDSAHGQRLANTVLYLTNRGDKTVKYQLSTYIWSQTPQKPLDLTPTDDLIFFPQILSIDPGETQKVRLATTTPATLQEKTYRVYLEELPPEAQVAKNNTEPPNPVTIPLQGM